MSDSPVNVAPVLTNEKLKFLFPRIVHTLLGAGESEEYTVKEFILRLITYSVPVIINSLVTMYLNNLSTLHKSAVNGLITIVLMVICHFIHYSA